MFINKKYIRYINDASIVSEKIHIMGSRACTFRVLCPGVMVVCDYQAVIL